jgi:hypothetical protein
MAKKDRTGLSYEQVITTALELCGYAKFGTLSDALKQPDKFYINPSPRAPVQIPDTYVQADVIVGDENRITHIFYVTHWSNSRSSQYKFWRTFEEMCQQKVAHNNIVSVNCIFESLPLTMTPVVVSDSSELPKDKSRTKKSLPIQLTGWAAANGWLMIDAFDVAILFPSGWDGKMLERKIIQKLLVSPLKHGTDHLWKDLERIRKAGIKKNEEKGGYGISSRYRIGFMHLFIVSEVFKYFFNATITPSALLKLSGELEVQHSPLGIARKHKIQEQLLEKAITALSRIPVRFGNGRSMLCELLKISHGQTTLRRIKWNPDFKAFLSDVLTYADLAKIDAAASKTFAIFSSEWCIDEMIEDLCEADLVAEKVKFTLDKIVPLAISGSNFQAAVFSMMANSDRGSSRVCSHKQLWALEMLLYAFKLKSTEDIQSLFKKEFQESGYEIRNYAPFGDSAKAVSYIIQGRDVCEQWGSDMRHDLTKMEFRKLSANAMANALIGKADKKNIANELDVVNSYLDNKALRIISSNLNGFFIMIDYSLGDISEFRFDEDVNTSGLTLPSCWTDIGKKRWGASPLTTQFEGRSQNGKWFIKIQSAQDGNEKHKVKELAGRGRSICIKGDWSSQDGQKFSSRKVVKRALILDGDWSSDKVKNLWEAGWDWVGDVNRLDDLRKMVMSDVG